MGYYGLNSKFFLSQKFDRSEGSGNVYCQSSSVKGIHEVDSSQLINCCYLKLGTKSLDMFHMYCQRSYSNKYVYTYIQLIYTGMEILCTSIPQHSSKQPHVKIFTFPAIHSQPFHATFLNPKKQPITPFLCAKHAPYMQQLYAWPEATKARSCSAQLLILSMVVWL